MHSRMRAMRAMKQCFRWLLSSRPVSRCCTGYSIGASLSIHGRGKLAQRFTPSVCVQRSGVIIRQIIMQKQQVGAAVIARAELDCDYGLREARHRLPAPGVDQPPGRIDLAIDAAHAVYGAV